MLSSIYIKNNFEINGIQISFIFLLITIIYFFCIIIIYICISRFAPEKLLQQNNNQLLGDDEFQYYCDCTCLYIICPCETFSIRHFIKNSCCCIKSQSLRNYFQCECLRPVINGTPAYRVDFVCCTV